MASETSLDYRYAFNSPSDAHFVQAMNEMMANSHNPMRLECIQDSTQIVPYSGQFRIRTSENIEIVESQLDSHAGGSNRFIVQRARSHIARNRSFRTHIIIWQKGKNHLGLKKNSCSMQLGDFFIMDSETPYNFHLLNQGHGFSLALPSSWDRIGDTRLKDIFGKLHTERDKRRKNVLNYVQHLTTNADALSSQNISDKLYDVLALALNPRAVSEHKAGLLAMIHNHLKAHSSNPELAPANVAATFNISVRYLHMLFEPSETSFAEFLLAQRLLHARHILADPRNHQTTILNIAFSCGFRDINHFGRRFRASYGVTPGEYRRNPAD